MSTGHSTGSGRIDKAWTDALVKLIITYARFDRGYNVPLAGGISESGSPVYQDKAIPLGYTQRDGKEVPAWHYLMVHETVEKAMMDFLVKLGAPEDEVYTPCHAVATAAELRALTDDGYDLKQYDQYWDREEKVAAKHKLGDDTPPDLELKPYESQ